MYRPCAGRLAEVVAKWPDQATGEAEDRPKASDPIGILMEKENRGEVCERMQGVEKGMRERKMFRTNEKGKWLRTYQEAVPSRERWLEEFALAVDSASWKRSW